MEKIEYVSAIIWGVLAVILGGFAFTGRRIVPSPEEERGRLLRSLLWGAFLSFTVTWIPFGAFDIVSPPVSFFFVQSFVTMPFDDGSWGWPRFGHSHVMYGGILVFSFLLFTWLAFERTKKKSR